MSLVHLLTVSRTKLSKQAKAFHYSDPYIPASLSPHSTHRLTTASTAFTPSLLASTSNHSLCSLPQTLHVPLPCALFAFSSICINLSTLCAFGTFLGVLGSSLTFVSESVVGWYG